MCKKKKKRCFDLILLNKHELQVIGGHHLSEVKGNRRGRSHTLNGVYLVHTRPFVGHSGKGGAGQ